MAGERTLPSKLQAPGAARGPARPRRLALAADSGPHYRCRRVSGGQTVVALFQAEQQDRPRAEGYFKVVAESLAVAGKP